MQICERMIGPGHPVYVIAELSANHHQDFERAARLIDAAKEAGADAIKLQTYTPDTITIHSDRSEFRIGGGTLWDGRSLYDLYGEAFTPWDWQPKLKQMANDVGLALFSSPFDGTAVDFLESMDVPAYKVASFELVDIPLIQKIARSGKPIIMSTGMSTSEEIEEALAAARQEGATEIALLKCTNAYPSPADEMNLRTIPELARKFGVPSGLSDHTVGIAVPVAAAALGACIIEKHLTLSRADHGPDSAFSLEPAEFKTMVDAVRFAEKALGAARFGPSEREQASLAFRRSLFVVEKVKSGHLAAVLGRRAACDIERGTPLSWDLVKG
jgi:pseudaminic acid synthase